MISMKLLRGALGLNQNVASIGNIKILHLSPTEDKKNHGPAAAGSKNLSFSSHVSQAAPLLTPKTPRIPKMSAALQEAEADLPRKPKKPSCTWVAFLRDNKDRFVGQKSFKVTNMSSELAKEWRTTDKSEYERKYQEEHEVYLRALENYENSLTDEQRSVIKLKKEFKKQSKATKILRGTKPPVLPRNPANLYCIDRCKEPEIKERMKSQSMANIFKDLFAEYRKLSDAQKERYLELQQKDKLRFQDEFNQWYESVQNDPTLSKTVRDKADILHARFRALNWI